MRRGRSMHMWDEQSDAQLKHLYIDQGLSGSLCGEKMGLSRCAVIGRANRLGLIRGDTKPALRMGSLGPVKSFIWTPEKDVLLTEMCTTTAVGWERIGLALGCAGSTASKRAKALGVEKLRAAAPPRCNPGPKVKDKRKPNPECLNKHKENRQSTGKIGILDLTQNMCRWPIGDPRDADFSFCGDECAQGSSYCSEHAVNSAERAA